MPATASRHPGTTQPGVIEHRYLLAYMRAYGSVTDPARRPHPRTMRVRNACDSVYKHTAPTCIQKYSTYVRTYVLKNFGQLCINNQTDTLKLHATNAILTRTVLRGWNEIDRRP